MSSGLVCHFKELERCNYYYRPDELTQELKWMKLISNPVFTT